MKSSFKLLIVTICLMGFSHKAFVQIDTTKIVTVTGVLCGGKKKNFEKKRITYIQNKERLDTLSYLKQFEVNKANYIGQPFSKLLNEMTQIQPKTAWSLPIKNKRNMVRNTSFKFCTKDYSFYDAVTLTIIWQTDIPYSETSSLGIQNQYYFTNSEKLFYSNKIVKDIKVYR